MRFGFRLLLKGVVGGSDNENRLSCLFIMTPTRKERNKTFELTPNYSKMIKLIFALISNLPVFLTNDETPAKVVS